jgi:hypothetical protein
MTIRHVSIKSTNSSYFRELSWVGMLIFIFVLLQSYWILPIFTRSDLSGGFRYADYTRIDTYNAFRQLGSYIWEWANIIGRSNSLIILGYVPIIIALGSILIKARDYQTTVFLIISILVIGLILLLNNTNLIERQVLYLTVFRDTSKLYALLNICTLVLIGFVLKKLFADGVNLYLKFLILIPIFLYVLIYLTPYWKRALSSENTLNTISTPSDSVDVVHWYRDQNNVGGKTLWLPTGTYRINKLIAEDQPEPYYTDVFAYLSGVNGGIQSVNYRHSLIADFWLINQFYDLKFDKDLGRLLGLFGIDQIFFRQDHEIQNWMSPYSARQWDYSSDQLRENIRKEDSFISKEQFGNLMVYQNNDSLPVIYPAHRLHALSGDLKHLTDMLQSEKYEYGNESFAIVNQNPNIRNINNFDSVILGDGNIIDLVLQFIPQGKSIRVEPGAYIQRGEVEQGYWSSVPHYYWAEPSQRIIGESAIAHTESILKIPIHLQKKDEYLFWGKIYFGPEASEISLNLTSNNQNVDKNVTMNTKSNTMNGFKWVEIDGLLNEVGQGSYQIDSGFYELQIENHPGWNVISELAIIPRSDFDLALFEVEEFLKTNETNYIYSFNRFEYTKDLYIPEDAIYSIRIHRVPKDMQSTVEFDSKADFSINDILYDELLEPASNLPSQKTIDILDPPIFIYQDGFFPVENYFGIDRRWGSKELHLQVINPNSKILNGNLQFSSLAPAQDSKFLFFQLPRSIQREFKIWVNGEIIGTFKISSSMDLNANLTYVDIPNIRLNPGINEIMFVSLEDTSPLSVIREYKGDERQVSIQIRDDIKFKIKDQVVSSEDLSATSQKIFSVGKDEKELTFNNYRYSKDDYFSLISRGFDLDIEEHQNIRITYQVESSSIQSVDVIAGIDTTGDESIDHYLVTKQDELPEVNKISEINLNLLEYVKKSFPIYYSNNNKFRLKKIFILLHTNWETNINNPGSSEEAKFLITNLQFYSDFHPMISKLTNRIALVNEEESESLISDLYYENPFIDANEQIIEVLGEQYTLDDKKDMFIDSQGDWIEIASKVFLPAGLHANGINLIPNEFYSTDIVELIRVDETTSSSQITEINFHKVNPTKYITEVNSDIPFHLIFSETYHKNWKAYIKNHNPSDNNQHNTSDQRYWYEQSALLTWLIERNHRQEITNHYIVNGFANGWHVPETGRHTIVLEYTPQRLFEFGALISLFTLLFCVTYLVRDWNRRRRV